MRPVTRSRKIRTAGVTVLALVTGLLFTLGAGVAAQAHGGPPRPVGCRTAPDTVALPAGLRPEGITSGRGTTFYVGSLADGRIVTGDLCRGTVTELLPGQTGRQLRGLMYDRRTDLVWAAGNVGTEGHVYAVSARSGRIVLDAVVPGAVFLNDLVVTGRSVWVTDSRVDRLTRIELYRSGWPGPGQPEFLPLRGDWPAGDGAAINANGIRQLSDGSLVLNNSRVGGLWQVSPRTGWTREIPVIGGPGITGGDGLELAGPYIYNVRGSGPAEVSKLRLGWHRAGWVAVWDSALTDDTLDVPSTATFAAGDLWAVNARFGVPSPGTADYWITRLPDAF